MAAKIGILGESTASSTSEVTVYTVPADKSARVRILFACTKLGASARDYTIRVGTPGDEVTFATTIAGSQPRMTMTGIKIATDTLLSSLIAIEKELDPGTTLDTPSVGKPAILPFPHDFILNAGDTVDVIPDGSEHLTQVIGVEDDA